MTGLEQVSFTSKTLENILSAHNNTISKIDAISDTQSESIHKFSALFDTLQQAVTTQQTLIADLKLKLSKSPQQSSRPKLDVPLFSGDNVLIWIFQMENFFAFHQTPCEQRLNIASLYMTGVAINWYHLMHRTRQISTWEAFIKSLELRFLNPESKQVHELTQTSTVSAYIVEFESLAAQTSAIGLVNVLDCFISGLRDDIKRELSILKPCSVSEAMCMAKLVEAGKLQSSPISPLLSEDDSVSTPLQGTMDPAAADDDKVTSLAEGGSTTPLGTTDTGLCFGGNGAALNYVGCFFEEGRRRSKPNDFISQMPDEVLVMILSLLPIKEAASTSIVSTRWRLVWRGLIKLNFHANQTFDYSVTMNSECDKYINQVNNVIQSYNHPMIEDFRIRYCLNRQHGSVIDKWLQFAINKNVEFLELDLSNGFKYYDYPLRLFEMKLVSLKKLILNSVNVSDAIFVNLLSNTPNLETLSIRDPQELQHVCVEIDLSFSHLPKLNKVDLRYVYRWSSYNVFEILSHCASSLQSLSIDVFCDKRPVNPRDFYELPNVKQLEMIFRGNKHDCLLYLAYMVNAFPSMESLKLEIIWNAPVVRRKARDYTNLHQHLKFVEIVGYYGRKCDFELAAYIIDIARALKKIVIEIPKHYIKKHDARCSAQRLESKLPQGVELVIL
ncbi:uncharacterized protein [Rutidosis leptorrhynchoides]|uniref:uncharacterized protein isoform X2 n=1 Tax=Rutidosis leptorrhynchoides TaxID=125765 RepID=UPI003A999BAD